MLNGHDCGVITNLVILCIILGVVISLLVFALAKCTKDLFVLRFSASPHGVDFLLEVDRDKRLETVILENAALKQKIIFLENRLNDKSSDKQKHNGILIALGLLFLGLFLWILNLSNRNNGGTDTNSDPNISPPS